MSSKHPLSLASVMLPTLTVFTAVLELAVVVSVPPSRSVLATISTGENVHVLPWGCGARCHGVPVKLPLEVREAGEVRLKKTAAIYMENVSTANQLNNRGRPFHGNSSIYCLWRAGQQRLLLQQSLKANVLRGGWMGQPNPSKRGGYDPQRNRPPYHQPYAQQGRHDSRYDDPGMPPPASMSGSSSRGHNRLNSVVVRGLAAGVTEQRLIDFFESVGAVTSIKLLPVSSRFPSGVAFVNFCMPEEVSGALRYDGSAPSWNAGQSLKIQRQQPLPTAPLQSSQAAQGGALATLATLATPPRASSSSSHSRISAAAAQWVQLLSRSTGKYYWFNKLTNESKWHVPSQVLAARMAGVLPAQPPPQQLQQPPSSAPASAEQARRAWKWGGAGGAEIVGQRVRRLRSTGEWTCSGLVVESKEISRERYVNRILWDHGPSTGEISLHRPLARLHARSRSLSLAPSRSRSTPPPARSHPHPLY